MLHDLVDAPGDHDGDTLHDAYLAALRDVVIAEGVGSVASTANIDESTVRALADGETPRLDLKEAAAIVAIQEDATADEIAALARDALLMGMTNAVLDVESLAAAVDDELEPREIQSKVEGRYPMTLEEFAHLHAHLQANTV